MCGSSDVQQVWYGVKVVCVVIVTHIFTKLSHANHYQENQLGHGVYVLSRVHLGVLLMMYVCILCTCIELYFTVPSLV